jgi:transcriptional regulator with XRE-family HTH domain
MAVSPSSSAQRARQDLAAQLREIRLDAGLSARQLSQVVGWHESKTSRIEHAKQAPADADVRAWCRACGAEQQAADLIAASRAADSMYVEWRRLHVAGMRAAQQAPVPLYERTRLQRVYTSTVIPGFFQLPGYATALMTAITQFQGTPDDVPEAVAARMDRNRLLYQPGHRFAVVAEESVLRYQVGDPAVMAGQLRHLLAVMTLGSVSLGVIPFTARQRPMWTLETFTVFDEDRVHAELLSAQIRVTTPHEVRLYLAAFRVLSELAVFGEAAQALITAAIVDLG